MSMLVRLVRSHGIKRGLISNEIKIYNKRFSSNAPVRKTDEDLYEVKRTWVSYGFDSENKSNDRQLMHSYFFSAVSICLVFGAFVVAYAPDPHLKDWAQREAYFQIRYREEHGLPLIDPNVVDPSTVTLPSEEELETIKVII